MEGFGNALFVRAAFVAATHELHDPAINFHPRSISNEKCWPHIENFHIPGFPIYLNGEDLFDFRCRVSFHLIPAHVSSAFVQDFKIDTHVQSVPLRRAA